MRTRMKTMINSAASRPQYGGGEEGFMRERRVPGRRGGRAPAATGGGGPGGRAGLEGEQNAPKRLGNAHRAGPLRRGAVVPHLPIQAREQPHKGQRPPP